jgi:hypothetical protein
MAGFLKALGRDQDRVDLFPGSHRRRNWESDSRGESRSKNQLPGRSGHRFLLLFVVFVSLDGTSVELQAGLSAQPHQIDQGGQRDPGRAVQSELMLLVEGEIGEP